MNLTITNQTCEDIIFNGHYLEKLYFGNDLVWEKQHGPTHDYSQDYFTIESLEDGNEIRIVITGNDSQIQQDPGFVNDLYYSLDNGANWTNIPNTVGIHSISLDKNEKAIFKANGSYWVSMILGSGEAYFSSTKTFDISGNAFSLLRGVDFKDMTYNLAVGALLGIFRNCKVVNAKNFILPHTTLKNGMVYRGMFSGCTQLLTTPELPATTLTGQCYWGMFEGCTSLVEAPVLPAITLINQCYYNMFNGCTSLNKVTCLAKDISASGCLTDWLNNVSSTGTFYKDSTMSSWPSGVSGIPTGWSIQNYN